MTSDSAPHALPAALRRHRGLRDAVVLVREDAPGSKRLVAYIVPTTNDQRPTTNEDSDPSFVVRRSSFVV